MSTALVIVDIQNDYFPGGRMEVVNAENALIKAMSLLRVFREQSKRIIHVRHVSMREGASFFLSGTKGVEIHENVSPLDGEKIITKHYPNSFRDTDLEIYLLDKGIKKIIVCGMMSHMCIDATVRAAFDKGFACVVADDACGTIDLSFGGVNVSNLDVHAAYMAALGAVYANVITSEEVIEQLE